jgi:hypothetical protein
LRGFLPIFWILKTAHNHCYVRIFKIQNIGKKTEKAIVYNKSIRYKTFPAQKERSLAKRLEIHYMPKHGSWLNTAEISINILSKQCIDRRIVSLDLLNSEIASWEAGYAYGAVEPLSKHGKTQAVIFV